MAYSVKADIQEILSDQELIHLTDDVAPVDTIDDDKITAAIKRADNQINTYLRGKASAIPIVPTPPRVTDWSVLLAIQNLYQRRVNLAIPETIEKGVEDVITELKGVRDGKILIDDAAGSSNTASFYKGQGAGTTSDKPQMFDSRPDGKGVLDGYYNGPDTFDGNRNC